MIMKERIIPKFLRIIYLNKKGYVMKKLLSLMFVAFMAIGFVGCAAQEEVKPQNIDKNNVSDTSMEAPDQTDPTLIEGNLEKNDFKN